MLCSDKIVLYNENKNTIKHLEGKIADLQTQLQLSEDSFRAEENRLRDQIQRLEANRDEMEQVFFLAFSIHSMYEISPCPLEIIYTCRLMPHSFFFFVLNAV